MMGSASDVSTPPGETEKKMEIHQIEKAKTSELVPGHPGYYEEGGLRTYGDDQDHDHEPPV